MKSINLIVVATMMMATSPRASADSYTVSQALDFLEAHRIQPTPEQEMVKWLGRAGLSAGGTVVSFFAWCGAFAFISQRPISGGLTRQVLALSPLGVIPVVGMVFYFATIVSVGMAVPRAAVIAISPFEFKERLSFSKFLDLPRTDQLSALADSTDQSRWIILLAERLSRGEVIKENRMYELLRADERHRD